MPTFSDDDSDEDDLKPPLVKKPNPAVANVAQKIGAAANANKKKKVSKFDDSDDNDSSEDSEESQPVRKTVPAKQPVAAKPAPAKSGGKAGWLDSDEDEDEDLYTKKPAVVAKKPAAAKGTLFDSDDDDD